MMVLLYIPAVIAEIALIFFLVLYHDAVKEGRGMGAYVGFIAIGAKDFWEHFPKEDDDEVYVAEAGIETYVCTGFPRESKEIRGIQAAYVEARRLGVGVEHDEKFRNPRMSAYEDGSYPNSVGVWWAVRKKQEMES